jgi:hypothetical protein
MLHRAKDPAMPADLTGRYAELATLLRDALPRLDDADVADLVTRMELSQEDISGMLRWLSFDAARYRARTLAADRYLRALTPDRMRTAEPAPPVPKPVEEKAGLWCTP